MMVGSGPFKQPKSMFSEKLSLIANLLAMNTNRFQSEKKTTMQDPPPANQANWLSKVGKPHWSCPTKDSCSNAPAGVNPCCGPVKRLDQSRTKAIRNCGRWHLSCAHPSLVKCREWMTACRETMERQVGTSKRAVCTLCTARIQLWVVHNKGSH